MTQGTMTQGSMTRPPAAPEWRIGAITAARVKAMQSENNQRILETAERRHEAQTLAEDTAHFAKLLGILGITDAAPTSRRYVDGEGDDAIAFEYIRRTSEGGWIKAYRWHDGEIFAESHPLDSPESLGAFLLGDNEMVYCWKNQLGSKEEGV